MHLDSLVPVNFSDVIVVAFSPSTGKSFIAQTFKSFGKAEHYIKDLRRYTVPYDFVIGDYTYRRKEVKK